MTSNCFRTPAALLLGFLLASCGGGGASGPTAPSGLSYPTPPAYTVNQAITALTPTVTGSVTGYAVSPALPAGFSLDATTGTISGKPTAIAAQATYTVTASNAGGDTTAQLSLVVNDVAPTLAYTSTSYGFTSGVPGQIAAPTVGGGTIVSLQVSPALPAGLAMSITDGSISGTPTSGAAAASYVVTATNTGGQATASLRIGVSSGPLVDLGHAATIQQILFAGSDALTQDASAHWILWNYSTGAMLARGNNVIAKKPDGLDIVYSPLAVALQGNTAVIQTTAGLEVRAASDGHVLAEISTAATWWKLASDGSYICGGNASGLTVWSPSGAVLYSESGAYTGAAAFAAPGKIFIGDGPGGQSVIETINLSAGTSSVSAAFEGTFSAWFLDGSSFFSAIGNSLWIYSNAVVQEDAEVLPATVLDGTGKIMGLTGQGGWYSTFDYSQTLTIYAVGASGHSAATYSQAVGNYFGPVASGLKIALLQSGPPSVTVIDLSGVTLSSSTYTTPIADLWAYGSGSGTAWLVGNEYGVLVDGATLSTTPRYLDYGAALSVAGGGTNIVVATASGRTLYFDAVTGALAGTINFSSSNVAMSSDGAVLAAAANAVDYPIPPDRTINIYSLPSMTLTNTFPFTYSDSGSPPYATGMTLSGSGTVLGEILTANTNCDSQAVPTVGTGVLWCDDSGVSGIVQLSPDGTLVAAVPYSDGLDSRNDSGIPSYPKPSTTIYLNGKLVTTLPVNAVGWLDNTHLLVSDFTEVDAGSVSYGYAGASIYSSTGQLLTSLPTMPYLYSIQVVNSDSVYSPLQQSIYSLTDGSEIWTSGSAFTGIQPSLTGGVSGGYVVFPAGNFVLAEPH